MPANRRPATKKAASKKPAPTSPFIPDSEAPTYNEVADETNPKYLPTFERWETHEEFIQRHGFNSWLTTTLRKAIP